MGNVAVRTGKAIEWHSKNMHAEGFAQANRCHHAEYRKGWEL